MIIAIITIKCSRSKSYNLTSERYYVEKMSGVYAAINSRKNA